jgi:hypothetical protein
MSAKILSNLESSINNYDNTGLFEIGFLMFLFGFALVFLVFFYSNIGSNDEPCPLSLSSNAKRILLGIGVIVAIFGLILSTVRWMTIAKI